MYHCFTRVPSCDFTFLNLLAQQGALSGTFHKLKIFIVIEPGAHGTIKCGKNPSAGLRVLSSIILVQDFAVVKLTH